ncbi:MULTISPECIES: hypothetical protein [Actinomadura]|uniref:Head-to-tail stopper n=1 Tax=Actinomadura yumaensis TaxID=111807 RepID=A0ABW2CXD9_9ACTN|nr:hypothetical protein [Actinomadura sp. J1-007]MWK39575.1 hypothetical protein [Actinomadura sp. J1-007]
MFGTDTLTVIRQPVDYRGDPAGPPTETPVGGCYVQPRGGGSAPPSTEDDDHRLTVTSGFLVFAPPGADIRASDRVRWRGQEYQVQGDPASWEPPGGPPHHREVILQRVKG